MYDRLMLDTFKKNLQYSIQTKLRSRDCISFDAKDIHDEYGNIFDAVVIDNIEDMGKYFQFSVVYASQAYAEFDRCRRIMEMPSSSSLGELTVTWSDKP